MIPFDLPPGVDPDGAFSLCVQISQFTALLDDGSSVDFGGKYYEWLVDSRCYTLKDLEKDIAGRVNWGSNQQIVVFDIDAGSGGQRELIDEKDLSLAFSQRNNDKKLFLFVDVKGKPADIVSNSDITEVESNMVMHSASAPVQSNYEPIDAPAPKIVDVPAPEIDWDSLEILPIAEDQIGAVFAVMDEDAMYEFVGLRAEDERVEKERSAGQKENEPEILEMDIEGADLPVDDHVPGEEFAFYDRDDPPMEAGTIYPSMGEFRAAVRQHAIKEQFELGTERSCKSLFRGYCKADSCKWAIVGRLMDDKKQVRITLNKEEHFCASTGRVRTKMATYHWVAEKAIPFLKKDANMKATKLQEALQDKYQVSIGYSTVWLGKQIAAEKIFGTWEESFAYLYNFKAEVEDKMPGSIVEIDVVNQEDGVYFSRFFCCFKPSIDGFLNGCRPFLSIDSTALNGRWNGHLPSATAIDGHNWMFPVAFGFFDGESKANWTWFMRQLQKAIGNPPHLAISSDACKGIERAVQKVFPWAEHRECFVPLMKNFVKKFQGPAFGRMYPAARTFQPQYHEYLMQKMYAENDKMEPWLKKNHHLKWSRSKFSEDIKCDYITNNLAEVWNMWVKDIKDLPIADLADTIRSKFMELYAKRRRIGEKLEGRVMLPIVVRQLNALSRQLGHLHVKEGGKYEAEVTEVTPKHKIIRHVVNLQDQVCTCREWQVSGKPCQHALALITTTRNPNIENYLHPYYSVYHFRLAYSGVIKPLPNKSQWPHVDPGFKVLPPLSKRSVGRQRKNRYPGFMENKGNNKKPRGKGLWKVKCQNCHGLGHRTTSPKCPLNGTKKRKSRAKKGPLGRPPGSSKKQKVAEENSEPEVEIPVAPVNTSQLALTMEVQTLTSDQVTTDQVIVPANPSTPPRRIKKSARKKITPRKAPAKEGNDN